MGRILDQFKVEKENLRASVFEILTTTLSNKNKTVPKAILPLKLSAQGGVGTSEEHDFLLKHYGMDSVGWGTPFLLVPEATTVDVATLEKLVAAKEKNLYLSAISPLGIPFHSLKGNTKDVEKEKRIIQGNPGSSCPKKFVALNKDFLETGICTASRQYQHLKIKELDSKNLGAIEYAHQLNKITEKSCTCVGLGTSALLAYNLDTKIEGKGVSICPGPNMAYFHKKIALTEMVDHIYGRTNVITRTDRPHMFVKELQIYITYLKDLILENDFVTNEKQHKYLLTFAANLKDGIAYYQDLFYHQQAILNELKDAKKTLKELVSEIDHIEIS